MKPLPQTKDLKEIWVYYRIGWLHDPALRVPAGLVPRLYAATIDYAFFLPLYLVFHNPVERSLEQLAVGPSTFHSVLIPGFIFAVPWVLYFFLPTFLWGQTLGKSAVGLRVAADRGRSHFLQILMRESVGKILAVVPLFLGVLMALAHPQKKMLHDILTQTVVLKIPSPQGNVKRGRGSTTK